jgi:hypothetical protein
VQIARWTFLLALLGAVAHGAEVYRSTDANGVVSFSDRPQGANAQQVTVATPRPGTPAPARQRPTRAAAGDAAAAASPATQSEPPAQTLAERAAERRENCASARERVERYAISHRLFRTLPDGEREYLSDSEIDQARSQAAADVENWCD